MSSHLSQSTLSTLLSHTDIHWISLWKMPRSLSLTPGKELDLVAIQILQLWQWHNITGPPHLSRTALPTKFSKSLLFLVLSSSISVSFSFLMLFAYNSKNLFPPREKGTKLIFKTFVKGFSFEENGDPKTKTRTLESASPHLPILNLP